MPNACYVHVPFCTAKCKYCNFVSFNKLELITGYIYSLLKEIDENYKGEPLKTLYFGGGTPSLVPVELLQKVINKFVVNDETEITLELNPENGDYEYLAKIRKLGINRLSIGAQTFNDALLKLIGRRHDSQAIIETVKNAKNAGFENISLDLIYGLPSQTTEDIRADLSIFVEQDVQHISTYGLKIEGNSYWGKEPPANLPDNDLQADMYEILNYELLNAGYKRYEVSNFAKDGYESKHNLTYWNNEEYYGIGVSAHGYADGVRYSNSCTLEQYLSNPTVHEYGKTLTEEEKLEEEIFLGFRKTEGVDIKKIKSKFNVDFEKKYEKVLKKYSDYIIQTNIGYGFNLRGTMLSNEILPEFLE